MSTLKYHLEDRYGAHRVMDVPVSEGEFPLLAIEIEAKQPVTLIMTNGLYQKEMMVPEKVKNRKHIELFFALPSYWEYEEIDNPKRNWIFSWIQKLAKHLHENDTWYGYGHTFSNQSIIDGKISYNPLSPIVSAQHLILLDPINLDYEIQKLEIDGKEIHFLAIVPIFSDELDYKQGQSARKLVGKMMNKGVSETIDEFRGSVLKRNWRFIK